MRLIINREAWPNRLRHRFVESKIMGSKPIASVIFFLIWFFLLILSNIIQFWFSLLLAPFCQQSFWYCRKQFRSNHQTQKNSLLMSAVLILSMTRVIALMSAFNWLLFFSLFLTWKQRNSFRGHFHWANCLPWVFGLCLIFFLSWVLVLCTLGRLKRWSGNDHV